MTPEVIAAIAGVLVSLGLQYIPIFKDWYNQLQDGQQKLVAMGFGFVVVAGAFGLGCIAFIAPVFACTGLGAKDAVLAFVAYVLFNQGFFALVLKKDYGAPPLVIEE